MQHSMIRRVVHPDVAQVVVAGLSRVLVGRGLKNRHRDRAFDQRLRLARMNQFGLESLDKSRHAASDVTTFITRRLTENRCPRAYPPRLGRCRTWVPRYAMAVACTAPPS